MPVSLDGADISGTSILLHAPRDGTRRAVGLLPGAAGVAGIDWVSQAREKSPRSSRFNLSWSIHHEINHGSTQMKLLRMDADRKALIRFTRVLSV